MGAITNIERERRRALYEQGMKQCTKCGTEKSLTEFHRNKNNLDGRCGMCQLCAKLKTAQWRSKNTERYREYDRGRYSDEKRSYCRDYGRRRRANDPTYARLDTGMRRALKVGAPSDRVTTEELLADWERRGIDPTRCIYSGEILQDGWTIDHAVPLSDPNTPGHVVTNLVPTNRSINSTKGRRHWVDFLADRAEAARA